jgi:hypothetical protein
MAIVVGPSDWWLATSDAINSLAAACPEGTILPDGSRIICRAGGFAWIIAPSCTEVQQTWNNSTTTLVGNKCCACDWPTLCSRLIACGFNPNDWCVPNITNVSNPGFTCRTKWDTFQNARYWSSTEVSATNANDVQFGGGSGGQGDVAKTNSSYVRAMRRITY